MNWQVPRLMYENIFKMVAVCMDSKGSLQEFPLIKHGDKDVLCFSPMENVYVESHVPASLSTKAAGQKVQKNPAAEHKRSQQAEKKRKKKRSLKKRR